MQKHRTMCVFILSCCALAFAACEAEEDAEASADTSSTTLADSTSGSDTTHEDATHEDATHEDATHEDAHHTDQPHWGYEGETGPRYWGDLSEDFALCKAGHAQSPIDIPAVLVMPASNGASLLYEPFSAVVLNNGHTVQVNAPATPEGEPAKHLMLKGELAEEWTLQQFHFHAQSEHTRDGQYFPLEVHFVHKNSSGDLAVVGVQFEAGESNPLMASLRAHWPAEVMEATDTGVLIQALDLIPPDLSGWSYQGSLTIPDCQEGVDWLVVSMTMQASPDEIEVLRAIIAPNSRPTQPWCGREINGQPMSDVCE